MPRRAALLCVFALALLAPTSPGQEKKSPSDRWEKAVAALQTSLKDKPPPKDAIFFAGSSSIVGWDVKKSFPDLPVVKVGFGGSVIADSTHFAPRILMPYRPRVIVLYAGDNDIAGGKTPEQVRDDFRDFVKVMRGELPETRIVFLSIKPSIARWKKIEQIRKANALVEALCKKEKGLVFVDVGTPLLGEDGMPRKELLQKDGLHLNAEGYKVWAEVLRPHLK